jgi:hypothetical protein
MQCRAIATDISAENSSKFCSGNVEKVKRPSRAMLWNTWIQIISRQKARNDEL